MATSTRTASQKKLWIGNLDKRLTEYNLLKIIQCYGEVENFQYLFHTVGPNKGEPRTYCFVEYKRREDAECALRKLNGKIVLSRSLRVRWAEETVKNDKQADISEKKVDSAQKKTVDVLSNDDKIKAIEEKLKLMEQSDKQKIQPVVFHGKHPLLAKREQQKEVLRKTKQKRRPYPAKNSS